MMRAEKADVACYAGGRYPDRPRSFTWAGQRLAVQTVEQEWRTPQTLVFDVRIDDERRFRLTYLATGDTWWVEPRPSIYPK
jgi:hypothetical protein